MDHHIATSAVHRCLCPPWLLQHTTVITQTSTRGSSETSCLMTHWIFVLPRWLSGSILFSTFLHWFQSGPHRRQLQEVNPDHPLLSYLFQLLLGKTMVCQGQMGDIIPPLCAGSASGAPFGLHMLKTAGKIPKRHPGATCWTTSNALSWCRGAERSSSTALRASWMIELLFLKLCVCILYLLMAMILWI